MTVGSLVGNASTLTLAAALSLGGGAVAQAPRLVAPAVPGAHSPAGAPYVPPGSLYDNGQSDGTTSLASQNSSGAATARTADDFTLAGGACGTGQFEITGIRAQLVQADAAPQVFAVDLYADNGAGTGPAPSNAITPIATLSEASQTNLGAFGVGTSLFQASFSTPGLVLDADTVYWISAYGGNGAANPTGFNNFFAVSPGGSTTDNGVIIAPDAGVATWTPVEAVIGGQPLAFSFAIDGACRAPDIPTLSPIGIAVLSGTLLLAALRVVRSRRPRAAP